MNAFRVTVDRDRCLGTGNCALVAPLVFGLADDGVAEVLEAAPAEDRLVLARRAALGCPARAITISDPPG